MNQKKQTEEHEDGPMHLQKEGKSCVIGFGIPNHLREVRKQQLYCSRPTGYCSTSHSSAAAARKPICMLSIHIFLFANKKVGFFSILQPKMKSNRMNCASEEPVRLRFWPSFQADKHFFRRPVLPWDDVCHASKDESHISTKEHP